MKSQETWVKMRVFREKALAKDILVRIAKYDGNLKEPRWMDVEQGATFDFVKRFLCNELARAPKDEFKTLCYVAGDISDVPCTLKVGESGKLFFYREFNLVLSVGLAKLKAQILWFDHLTVCLHGRFPLN